MIGSQREIPGRGGAQGMCLSCLQEAAKDKRGLNETSGREQGGLRVSHSCL